MEAVLSHPLFAPLVIMLAIAVAALGAWSLKRLPIDAVPDIDRVEGPFVGIKDPTSGADLDAAGIAALFSASRDQLPAELAAGLTRLEDAYLRGSTVRLDAISSLAPLSPAGTEVVPLVRADRWWCDESFASKRIDRRTTSSACDR